MRWGVGKGGRGKNLRHIWAVCFGFSGVCGVVIGVTAEGHTSTSSLCSRCFLPLVPLVLLLLLLLLLLLGGIGCFIHWKPPTVGFTIVLCHSPWLNWIKSSVNWQVCPWTMAPWIGCHWDATNWLIYSTNQFVFVWNEEDSAAIFGILHAPFFNLYIL